MNSTRLFLFAIVLVGLLAGLFQGHQALSRQRTQLAASQQRTARLHEEVTTLDHAHAATLRELALAEKQAAELSRSRPTVTNSDPSGADTELARWIARVAQLKQIVAAHPEQTIPEMRLLGDDDWLRVTRKNKLDSVEGVREMFAALRTAAKDRYAVPLAEAVRQFNAAAPASEIVVPRPGRGGAPGDGGTMVMTIRQPPATAMALAPYLANPADADVLQRLEVVNRGSGWILREPVPIDGEYDAGYRLFSNGGSSGVSPAPWAWFPADIDERFGRANSAYRAAHNGLSPAAGLANTLPYFDPPLEPAIAEKILKAERESKR